MADPLCSFCGRPEGDVEMEGCFMHEMQGGKIGPHEFVTERPIQGEDDPRWGVTDRTPPGPPPVPTCAECGAHPMRHHTAGCTIGAANERHWSNVAAVEAFLLDTIRLRRTDREFMEGVRVGLDEDEPSAAVALIDLMERIADA